jgi:hypothetical protein
MNDEINSLEMKRDSLAKKLGSAGSSGSVAGKNGTEKDYALVSIALHKARHNAGLVGYMPIKKKYKKGL